MFESKMEQKINEAIEENVSDERLEELGLLVTGMLEDNVDGLPLADVVVIKNILETALTQHVLNTAMNEGVITQEDIAEAYAQDPMSIIMKLIEEAEAEEAESLDNDDEGLVS